MAAAYNYTTLYCPHGDGYTLTAYFTETKTDPNNTSKISVEGKLIPSSGFWTSQWDSTLEIYWHDNKDNVDVLVSSTSFKGLNGTETKSVSGEITVAHKSDGSLSGYVKTKFIKGNTDSSFAPYSGEISTTLTALTTISLVKINSFTGTSINGIFKANYTPISGGSYTYKLRISIPNVVALQKYNNYSSNQEVTLSNDSKQTIKSYTTSGTITLGGVIEVYSGADKVTESTELMINVSTKGNSARLRINGQWKEAKPYIRVNGQWKEAKPYIRVNNQWKEGI